MEELNTEKDLNTGINQEESNELVEKLRNIFTTALPIIQEKNIERNSLPKTVLIKLEELAVNTVLKEEIDKILLLQSDQHWRKTRA